MTASTSSVTLTRKEAELAAMLLRHNVQFGKLMGSEGEHIQALAAVAECLQHLLDGHSQIALSEDTP